LPKQFLGSFKANRLLNDFYPFFLSKAGKNKFSYFWPLLMEKLLNSNSGKFPHCLTIYHNDTKLLLNCGVSVTRGNFPLRVGRGLVVKYKFSRK
jgi:hypothetical protein